MPPSTIHKPVGAAAGAALGLAMAHAQRPNDILLEVLAAGFTGYHAAKLPDVIDPPIHPRHRSVGHGVLSAGPVIAWILHELKEWQDALRTASQRATTRADEATSSWERLGHQIVAVLLRLLAGALAGFVGGYGSHLAMDACTKSGLPVFA
ncbi:MAG: hypothetical protein IPJ19_19865 [Planctomycetes bacterium]|nr:hypothetical protein [Planctomycetota bacterium]